MQNAGTKKSVLITGSSRGLGKLISEKLLGDGYSVIGISRGLSAINHNRYDHYEVDLTDESSILDFFSLIRSQNLPIDILINNAAILTSQYAMIMPPSAAKDMLNINLFAPFIISRESAKIMRKKKWGRIVNISSMAVRLEPNGDSIYAASKAALNTLSNILAKEFAPLGITSNTIGISAIETDMLRQLPKEKIDEIVGCLTIPRYAEPADVFNLIDFLISEQSSYITAQTIYLGGVN